MGENGHTMLEREVADIILSLLHRQGFDSGRRFRRRAPRAVPSYFCFPRWGVKRKRSVLSPAHTRSTHGSGDCGKHLSISSSDAPVPSSPSSICDEPALPQKSPKISFVDKEPQAVAPVVSGHCCPNVMEARFNMKILERGSLFWAGQSSSGGGSKKFVLPDLNMSVEELVAAAADAELCQRQHLVAVAADAEMRQRQHELYETACRRLAAADARRRRRELQKLKNSIAAGSPLCSRVR